MNVTNESVSVLNDYYSSIAASFETAWSFAPDALVVADPEGKIIYANPAYYTLYGLEEDEAKEHYFDTLFQKQNPFEALEKYQVLFHQEIENHLIESRVLWADGCERITETALHFMYHLGSRVAMVAVIRDITSKRIFQERKQLENALVESERKFRAVFNKTFQFTGLLKPNGTLLEANQTLLDFAGVTQTDVANKPFWEAPWWNLSQKNQVRLRNMITEAAKGKLMRAEFEMAGLNRTVITVDFSLTPTKDETDKVVWLIAEARNITDRKRMEVQLRVSEEKYKALFQVFPVGILLTDETGHIIDANPASERILGVERELQVGKYIINDSWRAIDEKGNLFPAQELPALKALHQNKVVKSEEMGLIRPDKSVVWLNVTATPIPLRNYGVALAFIDVTQSRMNKESIMASEARYRLLFDNTRYAILRTTPQLNILEANTEACKLFGYTSEEMLLASPSLLNDVEDDRLNKALEEVRTHGNFKGEVSLLKSDGSRFLAELSIKTLSYENGNRELCVTIRAVK